MLHLDLHRKLVLLHVNLTDMQGSSFGVSACACFLVGNDTSDCGAAVAVVHCCNRMVAAVMHRSSQLCKSAIVTCKTKVPPLAAGLQHQGSRARRARQAPVWSLDFDNVQRGPAWLLQS